MQRVDLIICADKYAACDRAGSNQIAAEKIAGPQNRISKLIHQIMEKGFVVCHGFRIRIHSIHLELIIADFPLKINSGYSAKIY